MTIAQCRRMRLALVLALSVALPLLAEESASACKGYLDPTIGCPSTYGSIGPLLSIAFTGRGDVGFGAEFSVNHLPDSTSYAGFGTFINWIGYFTRPEYMRLNFGAQGELVYVGGEAGVSYLSATSGLDARPASFGLTAGVFSEIPYVLLLAVRTTFPFDGPVHTSVDIGVKIPFLISGHGYYNPGL